MLKVTPLLADHADVASGKLYINGGGWSITGPAPAPYAIVLDVKVPWDERELTHEINCDLLDSDGQPVLVPTPQGLQPYRVWATLDMPGPFEGVKPGTPLDAPMVIPVPPIPLAPGGRYEWRLTVDGHEDEDWTLPFTTRPAVMEAEAA
jgi:hypothetical protein